MRLVIIYLYIWEQYWHCPNMLRKSMKKNKLFEAVKQYTNKKKSDNFLQKQQYMRNRTSVRSQNENCLVFHFVLSDGPVENVNHWTNRIPADTRTKLNWQICSLVISETETLLNCVTILHYIALMCVIWRYTHRLFGNKTKHLAILYVSFSLTRFYVEIPWNPLRQCSINII